MNAMAGPSSQTLDNGAKPEGTGRRDDYFRFYEKENLPEFG